MSEKKPTSSDDFVVIPDSHRQRGDLDYLEKSIPLRESIIPSMQAPEDWPPPPDVDKDKGNKG